jgi:two-component system CheB/CheR fusion protein
VRVLIVDDCVDTVDSLTTLLQFQGVEVRVAYDGLSALKVAQEFRPRVVLLDLGLPALDGWEVARQLKALDQAPYLVAVTGHAGDRDRERSKAAGIDLHLAKPVDPDLIILLLSGLRGAEGAPPRSG